MQVTAINSAYTGAQRHTPGNLYHKRETAGSFEEVLAGTQSRGAAMELTDDEIRAAMDRALMRLETLLGEEVAESVVNEDGSINMARFTQVMNAAEKPYANSNQSTFVYAPQLLDMIA